MINYLLNGKCRYRLMTGAFVLGSFGLFSCDGYDLDEKTPGGWDQSIYSYLVSQGNYTEFVRLINDLGDTRNVLERTGSKTLFPANDEAFAKFYQNNKWGVTKYEDLSEAQKKLLLNTAMINSSYQINTLADGTGPLEGGCMRRITALSIYDSVPVITAAEMPDNGYWKLLKTNHPTDARVMKDNTTSPIVHFMEKFLTNHKITNEDYNFLFNNAVSRNPGDASINGVEVVDENIRCLNGFIHRPGAVVTPLDNMAEIIRTTPELSRYSSLLERFAAPYPLGQTATDEYNRLYNTNVDTVYVKRYFAKRAFDGKENVNAPGGTAVDATLKFDPGWNQYYIDASSSFTTDRLLSEDMSVMIAPTDAALDDYWNNGGGKALKEQFGSWENVPNNVIAKLLNVNMLNSFDNSVPSKFDEVVDDASLPLGVSTSDISRVELGNNGFVYVSNKVYGPSSFRSVSFPTIVYNNLKIFEWAIERLEFFAYLNSMDSYYSFFIPRNNAMMTYVDPVSYGMPKTRLFKFWYDETQAKEENKVRASIWNYDLATGVVGDSIGMATVSQIENRLQDILDNHTVVGNVEDGHSYYKTKNGGVVKVEHAQNAESTGAMTVAGTLQMEQGTNISISKENVINMFKNGGNGKSYIMEDAPLMTTNKSVYDVLSENPDFSEFLGLLRGSSILESSRKITETSTATGKAIGSAFNIHAFNTYNYTVYVPTNEAMQKLFAGYTREDGKFVKLPTWAEYEEYSDRAKNPAADATDEQIKADKDAADSIKALINGFIKYHIQDNAVYIGGEEVVGQYPSQLIDVETENFYKMTINSKNSGGRYEVKDAAGFTHYVDTSKPYNLMAREYVYDKQKNVLEKQAANLETSSFAVIHAVNTPLFYDKNECVVPSTSKSAAAKRRR